MRQRVLLVLVGALGDLAWRKFIAAARIVEMENPNVGVLLVDVPWPGRANISLADELNWRIARRRIEIRAEQIGGRKVQGLSLNSGLGNTQFPWCVDDFVAHDLRGDADALELERKTLQNSIDDWVLYFTEHSPVTELRRYSTDPGQLRTELDRMREQGWKVAVLIATPPQAYAPIINQWEGVADRILLEKPAGCLNPQTLAYSGAEDLRRAANRIQMPSQIATNDHYNSKAIVRMMDRTRDYHLFDALLDPARIKRVVIELLESAPLPLGRYGFYNGAGGAFGDMVPHLLQAVRAIMGIPQGSLKIEFEKFYWARCDCVPLDPACCSRAAPYSYEPNYYQPLAPETETFVAFKALIKVGDHLIPLYCRTGKGIKQPGKTLRVDTRYGDNNTQSVSLIFNIEEESLTIRDSYKFIMTTGRISLTDPFQSGVPPVDTSIDLTDYSPEYKSIFDALVKSDWTEGALDHRYFPSVKHAADLSDMIFEELIKERKKARTLHRYSIDKSSSYVDILGFLKDEAQWG